MAQAVCMNVEIVFFVITGLWLLGLSAVLFWVFNNFRRLTNKTKKGNLIKVLDRVLTVEAKNTKGISQVKKQIKKIELEGQLHVQKVGLVRFNPFNELGGSHSFALSLLDGKDAGVIITGLHTRERTRVYIKHIKDGKSKYDLSKEERKALQKVIKNK